MENTNLNNNQNTKNNNNRNHHNAYRAAVLRECNGTLMPLARAKMAKAAKGAANATIVDAAGT